MAGRYSTGNVRSAYAGGYSEAIKRQMERVVMPDKVKCEVCKKFRMQSAFSKRQLESLRNAFVVQGPRAAHGAHAKCRDCVGIQNFELRCCICDQTKGLEDFAKNQRQNRDAARCLNCVQSHTDSEPVLEETKYLLEYDSSAASTATSQLGDGTYADSTRRSSGRSEHIDGDASSTGGGVWLENEDEKDRSEGKKPAYQYNAYDSQGNLYRRTATPSEGTPSVHGGWDSWGVTASSSKAALSSYNYSIPTPKRSNFARIPSATRAERSNSGTIREPEPAPPAVQSDDEDDNDVEDYL